MNEFILFILFLLTFSYLVTKINGGEYYDNLMLILISVVIVFIIFSVGIFGITQFQRVFNL